MGRSKPGWKATAKKYYLFLYNITLFLIHGLIFLAILDEVQHRNFVYFHHYPWLLVATALQFLDIFHAFLGWTKTGIGAGLVQIFGRLFVLWVAYYVELDEPKWSTQLLCLAYMSIELFRYPYYAARVLGKEPEALTWLRYNAWLVCYPIGLSMEFLTLYAAFGGRHLADLYSQYTHVVVLKEPWFKWAFQIFVLYIVFPTICYILLSHMWHQREKKKKEVSKKKH